MIMSFTCYRLTTRLNFFYRFNDILHMWPMHLFIWLKEEGRKPDRKKVSVTKSNKSSSLMLEPRMNNFAFCSPPQQLHEVNTSLILWSATTFWPQAVNCLIWSLWNRQTYETTCENCTRPANIMWYTGNILKECCTEEQKTYSIDW